MTRNRIATALAAGLLVFSTHIVRADVRTEEKTHVEFAGMLGRMVNFFGGKAAKEGIVSTVAVKGSRKATMNDQTGQIIDLTEEKVYDIDVRKKSYKVTTFAELRQKMEDAQKKAEAEQQKEQGKPEASAPPAANQNQKQMKVDVDIKNTGEKKTINGFDTHEVIMTITLREDGKTLEQGGGMVTTSDMWLTPRIAAMKEIGAFDARYAQQLYGGMIAGASAEQMAAAMAMYPMMKQALGRMTTEGTKMDGTAIMTTVTMDAVKSEDEVAQEAKAKDDGPKPIGAGGLFGSLAKKVAAKKAGGGAGDDASKARATFMTSTNEVLKVSTTVAPEDVAVPAGFKQNK
jgi:hypothetical protein